MAKCPPIFWHGGAENGSLAAHASSHFVPSALGSMSQPFCRVSSSHVRPGTFLLATVVLLDDMAGLFVTGLEMRVGMPACSMDMHQGLLADRAALPLRCQKLTRPMAKSLDSMRQLKNDLS